MRWARRQHEGWDDADVRAILLYKIIRTEAMVRARAKASTPPAAVPLLRGGRQWLGGVVVPLGRPAVGRMPPVPAAPIGGSRTVEPAGNFDARRHGGTRHGRTLAAFLVDGGAGG